MIVRSRITNPQKVKKWASPGTGRLSSLRWAKTSWIWAQTIPGTFFSRSGAGWPTLTIRYRCHSRRRAITAARAVRPNPMPSLTLLLPPPGRAGAGDASGRDRSAVSLAAPDLAPGRPALEWRGATDRGPAGSRELEVSGGDLGVGVAQAGGHGLQQLVAEAGDVVEHGRELPLAQDQQAHVGVRQNRRVAGHTGQQGQLAHVLAGSDGGDLAVLAPDDGGALEDQEELLAGGPLLHDHLPRRHLDLVAHPGDPLEIPPRAGGEQPHLTQVIDLLVPTRHGARG